MLDALIFRDIQAMISENQIEYLSGIDDNRWLDLLLGKGSDSIPKGVFIPTLPPRETQQKFNAQTGEANLAIGLRIYQLLKATLDKWGVDLAPDTRVLDFGCGWGRVSRFFAKDVSPNCFFGVDVSDIAIDICSNTLQGEFRHIQTQPPMSFPDNSFDAIYAWSVFSHLPEDLHLAWLKEFSRMLRPGGLLMLSTLRRNFIVDSLRMKKEGRFDFGWREGVAEYLEMQGDALRSYDNGEFIFAPFPKPDYGQAMIPENYVRSHWGKTLEFCEFIESPPSLGQSLIVMRS